MAAPNTTASRGIRKGVPDKTVAKGCTTIEERPEYAPLPNPHARHYLKEKAKFSLKAPKRGSYKVQANFYGHRQQIVAPATTLVLQLFTDFGTPRQKMEQVILRLSGAGEKIDVGEFVVDGGARPAP